MAQDRQLAQEIKRKDPAGDYLYPPGKVRNEEYAALFAETYFTNNRRARKNLMGEKITVTEKLFGYAAAAFDIVKGACGNNAALARSFLRRVERNKINAHEKKFSPGSFCLCAGLNKQ